MSEKNEQFAEMPAGTLAKLRSLAATARQLTSRPDATDADLAALSSKANEVLTVTGNLSVMDEMWLYAFLIDRILDGATSRRLPTTMEM